MVITHDRPGFISGLLYLLTGTAFAGWSAFAYPLGTPSRMGPGFFPFWLGILLALTGLFILLRLLKPGERISIARASLRPLGWIFAAIALFILTLDSLGLVIAVLLLVLVSGQARRGTSLKQSLVLGGVAALFSSLVFVKGLGLIMPLWPSFGGA